MNPHTQTWIAHEKTETFTFKDDRKEECHITLMRKGRDAPTKRGPVNSTEWCFEIDLPDCTDYSKSVELALDASENPHSDEGMWYKIRWLGPGEEKYQAESWCTYMEEKYATRLRKWLKVCASATPGFSLDVPRYHAQQPNNAATLKPNSSYDNPYTIA